MAVGALEQIWNLTTSAAKIMQFQSSRYNFDVHQTAGVGLDISLGLPLLVLAALYYWFGASILSVKSSKSGLPVPPGNPWMLPICGETFQMAINCDSFITNRIQRYGEIFTSHIFGAPTVFVTSMEEIKHVLASPNHKNFKLRFPSTVSEFFGAAKHCNITHRLILILGDDIPVGDEMEIFHEHVVNLKKGMTSVPLNIPGTPYSEAIKARKAILHYTERVMEKRKGMRGDNPVLHEDVLEGLMNFSIPEEGITGLTDEQIRDNILFGIVVGHDTTACALSWLLKFLAESPDDLQEIVAEHQAIADCKGSKDYELTYDDILRMPASTRAFLEDIRLVPPTFGVARKATDDVELNGKFIPKGWSVFAMFEKTHFNSEYYPDPCKFNPSRFKAATPNPGVFLSFGSGPRLCPGQGLAKANALVLLHRLVLGYRWELVGKRDCGKKFPLPVPKGGLPIAISRIEGGK